MNRTELVELVAERTGSDRAVARRHVDAVFEAIIDGVSSGDRVLVTGFGTFERFDRPARTARNPRTGQPIEVAAGTVPRFRFGQTFKNRVAESSNGTQPEEAEATPAKKAKKKKNKKKNAKKKGSGKKG